MVMPRIATSVSLVVSASVTDIRLPSQVGRAGDGPVAGARPATGPSTAGPSGSVLPVGQRGLRLLLGEGLVGRDLGLRDRLAGDDLLDEVGDLWAEQRVALDDVVELPVGEGLQAVMGRVDRHDLDVLARHHA